MLSGGGSDGSRGISHVHETGGLVLVQDLDSAQFDGMPKAAIETGVVDHTLRPEDMPRVLLERAAGSLADPPSTIEPEPETPRGLDALYRVLETEFGLDFNSLQAKYRDAPDRAQAWAGASAER